ncbi:MAG TPA: hypothetical protein VGR81_03815 [Candidatus Acidoferrales bacterium]|nr:hypothetical protein [Candidatus Acidoferrales bacterium]
MQKDARDLLDVIKAELEFLESGGYERTAGESWRPAFIFEDSPACVNYGRGQDPLPCSDCALIQLVPFEFRSSPIPCRHIPFNTQWETLDSLYRYADRREIEKAVREWLQDTVTRLENERKISRQLNELSANGNPTENARGAAMNVNLQPKCANPACPNAFSWSKGGKFFRFRTEPNPPGITDTTGELLRGVHGVKHFWLCDRCSHVFTLVCTELDGVVLKLVAHDVPSAESVTELPAA